MEASVVTAVMSLMAVLVFTVALLVLEAVE